MNYSEQSISLQNQIICIFGIYFCQRCGNMMTPINSKDTMLYFKCQTCAPRNLDYKNKTGDQCVLKRNQLRKAVKKQILDVNLIFDPSMPTVEIKCPQCGFGKAIYFLIPNQDQQKMIARMMCKNAIGMTVKCGNVWDINDESVVDATKVIVKQLEDED